MIFIQEKEFESVVYKMAAILSRALCVTLTTVFRVSLSGFKVSWESGEMQNEIKATALRFRM